MSSNPANQPIEDPFLRWRQEMEAKQEEQARKMAELRENANHLLQENECLWARLETNGVENPQGAAQPVPITRADKGKGPALPAPIEISPEVHICTVRGHGPPVSA